MKHLYGEESLGASYGHYQLDMKVECNLTQEQIRESDAIREAIWQAADILKKAILAEVIKNDPKTHERAKAERDGLMAPFPSNIFAEPIPNGYCNDFCCRHLPWFIVTTEIGKFKIGWRKRVIHLEWTDTVVKETADKLFPNDDVTKSDRTIHAWSYEDAKRYITKIFAHAK